MAKAIRDSFAAYHNHFPGSAHAIIVTGKAVADQGAITLEVANPQGFNPAILLLNLSGAFSLSDGSESPQNVKLEYPGGDSFSQVQITDQDGSFTVEITTAV